MKILMFGRGVISTLYGWALEKAGNEVDFYVRPGRAADFGSSVDVDIRDGRASSKGKPVQENWPITLREDLEPDHDYDLIIVSVNHDQLDSAVDFLQPRVGRATILIFNNVWADPAAA
ncbi:MAG: ketopantoate reductase family protein, partial [Brevibacterium aurantiacum]